MKKATPRPSLGVVLLRDVSGDDLPTFFEQQLDPCAYHMAAFTAKDPSDRTAFSAHWVKILADDAIKIKTILYGADIAGHIASHEWFGDPEVTCWIGKEFWGMGITTRALSQFLSDLEIRPLYARAAKDNIGLYPCPGKMWLCGFGPRSRFCQRPWRRDRRTDIEVGVVISILSLETPSRFTQVIAHRDHRRVFT